MPIAPLLLLLLCVVVPAQDVVYRGHHAQAILDTYIGEAALKEKADEVRHLVFVGLIAGLYDACNVVIDNKSVGWYELDEQGHCRKMMPRDLKAEWKTTVFTSSGKTVVVCWALVRTSP